MINLIISLVIIVVVGWRISSVKDRTRKEAYKWWYIPWAGVIYALFVFSLYQDLPLYSLPVFRLFVQQYQLEAVFSLLGIILWSVILPLLKKDALYKSLTSLYRRVFAGKRNDRLRVLPFPYQIDSTDLVRSRVGQVFYRKTVKTAAILIAMVYALYFVVLYFFQIDFYLKSAFGLLALIPIIDYYLYLCAEVKTEEDIPEGKRTREVADFERLWGWYIKLFDDYSIAWKRTGIDRKEIKQKEEDNAEEVNDLLKRFTGSHMDGIIEDCDLTEALQMAEPLMNWTEKNGKSILVALDIPQHFPGSHMNSFVENIAEKLRTLLRKEFIVYDENTPRSALNDSIVIAPLSLLSRQELASEWLCKIGMIAVVNLFDKGISNLYDCRKFCFLLQAVNQDYQILFINPYRRGAEPSLRNTWVTRNQITEKRLVQFPHADSQFYIGYNFEDYKQRFEKILSAKPSEPLYSGLELASIALSSKLRDEDKPVTPVHYLDLAYTSIEEGKEELGKIRGQLNDSLLKVSATDINLSMVNHVLPVDSILQNSIISIIFDQENNAPAAYAKWAHLGQRENLTIVVSRPYLFRDYFNANPDYFTATPFASLQPHLSKSRITLAIILLDILRKTQLEERRLRDLLRYYYDEKDVKSVSGIVRQLFDCYFASSLANSLQTAFSVSFEGGHYYHNTFYGLDIKDDISLSYLNWVSVQDESGNVIIEILRDLLYQNYEPGQIHSFSGKPFIIKEYDETNQTLKVSAANNTDDDIVFYRPVLDVTISSERTPIKEMERLYYEWSHPVEHAQLSLSFEGFETNVSVTTKKWYTFHRYSIVGADYFISESHSSPRVYPRGKVLKVTMRFLPKQEYLDRIDEIRKGLQILLFEAIQSVFPQHAQYLVISSQGEVDRDLPWIFNSFHADDCPEVGALSFYFIEDAHIDLGLIGALSNRDNFGSKYLFHHIYNFLLWLTKDVAAAKNTYDAYLPGKSKDKTSFLKYGRESLPPYFDIALLVNFLRDYFCDDIQNL